MTEPTNDFERLRDLATILQSPGDVVAALDSLSGATAALRTEREQLDRAREAHAEGLAKAEAEHAAKIASMSAANIAASEQRSRVLSQREAALEVERRMIDEQTKLVAAKELAIEHRAQDMGNRLRLVTSP